MAVPDPFTKEYWPGSFIATSPLRQLPRVGPKASTRVGVRDGLLQLRDLGFQEIVRDDQRANGRAHIAVTDGDRLLDGRVQPIVLFVPRGSVKIPRVWSLETPPLDNRGQRR